MFGQGSGAAGGSGGGAGAAAAEEAVAEPVKEKEAFDIKISAAVDAKAKIKVIKEVRAITGLGLKEVIDDDLLMFCGLCGLLSFAVDLM